MSSRANKIVAAPERLVERSGLAAELLSRANEEFRSGPDELEAFQRLVVRLDEVEPEPARWKQPMVWALPLVASFCVAASLLVFFWRTPNEDAERVVARQTAAATRPAARDTTLAPSSSPTALSAGSHRFSDGTRAELGTDARADVRRVERATRVTLERGSIELRVAPQAAERRFEVASGAYRFQVLGTIFRVDAAPDQVTLEVREGQVAVFQGDSELARIGAGQRWISPRPADLDPKADAGGADPDAADVMGAPPSRAEPAPREPEPDCLALARDGEPKAAERCFDQRTRGSGLGAEMALYEVARLRRDVLGDVGGALSALHAYRARFPNGSLRREVDVSYVELLARLGRHQEALGESGRVLSSAGGRERAAELHLLRGNIYRKSLGDPAAAEREYAAAARSGGALGAEALYLRALTLEALGNPAAARALYEEYLRVPRRPRHQEARRRLDALSP